MSGVGTVYGHWCVCGGTTYGWVRVGVWWYCMWACGGTTCGCVVVLHVGVGVQWYYMWACGGTTYWWVGVGVRWYYMWVWVCGGTTCGCGCVVVLHVGVGVWLYVMPQLRPCHPSHSAALQSVFPPSELGSFMALTKQEKQAQLVELVHIVTGIRLFNKECGKGGAGIDDRESPRGRACESPRGRACESPRGWVRM